MPLYIMDDFQRLSVKQLQNELRNRGAKTSGRKEELIQRLMAYMKLQIQPCPPPKACEFREFPSAGSFEDLTISHKVKITITNVHLMDYFVFRKSEIDGAPVSNYKSLCESEYRLFSEKFVLFIKRLFQSGEILICSAVKSEYTKHKTYNVKLILGVPGDIIGGECECVAGAGPKACCKHIAAVSYALEHFSKTGIIQCSETCTQNLQTFHHPPTKRLRPSSPMQVECLPLQQVFQEPCHDVRPLSGVNQPGYQQYVEGIVRSSQHKLAFSFALKKEKASCFDVIHDHHYGVDPCVTQAENLVRVNDEERKKIEENTRQQSQQSLWFKERKYRLTSSNIEKICHSKTPKVLAKALFKGSLFCSRDMKWGLQMEDSARERYSELTGHVVQKCGLIIHPTKHYLAASCDGLIGQDRVLELKGLPSHENETISIKYVPYLEESSGAVILKKNHNYYFQVQGQLFVTGRHYCSFVVYTAVDMLVLDMFSRTASRSGQMFNSLNWQYMKLIQTLNILPTVVL